MNQIQRGYNGLGQLTIEYQAVNGSVNTGSTPKVQYGYSEMASSANHSRLNTITYPNGRVLTYNYASGLDNNISRLSSISDGGTTLESYDYLGYGTVVSRKHAESGVDLTYIKLSGESDGSAGDKYIGLDLFGRVIDQRWTTSGGTTKDRFAYGYDCNSNRLYKENLVSSSNSELYAYDNLNQLTSMERGTLNGGKTALTGAASRSQSWDFDALGNFDSQSTNGTGQSRTHNKQNEITSIAGATTPTHDANGSLTTDETGQTYEYDGWNRLVEVKNSGGTTIALNEYDGITRRVQETRSGTTRDMYYSDQWQVLEERISGNAHDSYVWSPIYIDAMIARDRDSDNNGSLDERLYVTCDANFNVTGLVNTSGTVVERYQYDPYGTATYFDASFGSRGSSSYNFKYLHQGGRWDSAVGVYSFRNRELNPILGRWLQIDPIGLAAADSLLYRYCSDNPNIYIDPLGLDPAGELKKADLPDKGETIIKIIPFLKPRIIVVDASGKIPNILGTIFGEGVKKAEITEAESKAGKVILSYGSVQMYLAVVPPCGNDPKDYYIIQTRQVTTNGRANAPNLRENRVKRVRGSRYPNPPLSVCF